MKEMLIKVSGDLFQDSKFLKYVDYQLNSYNITILVGGGKQINEALLKAGYKLSKHTGLVGRCLKTKREKEIAMGALYKNTECLSRYFRSGLDRYLHRIKVEPSHIMFATKFIHINGDLAVLSVYHGFDKLIVITTKERVQDKEEFFKPYKKIEVIGL